jgi:hypothetical protein
MAGGREELAITGCTGTVITWVWSFNLVAGARAHDFDLLDSWGGW